MILKQMQPQADKAWVELVSALYANIHFIKMCNHYHLLMHYVLDTNKLKSVWMSEMHLCPFLNECIA